MLLAILIRINEQQDGLAGGCGCVVGVGGGGSSGAVRRKPRKVVERAEEGVDLLILSQDEYLPRLIADESAQQEPSKCDTKAPSN